MTVIRSASVSCATGPSTVASHQAVSRLDSSRVAARAVSASLAKQELAAPLRFVAE